MKLKTQSNVAGHRYGDAVDSADLDAMHPDSAVPYSQTLLEQGHATPWDGAPAVPEQTRVTPGEVSVVAVDVTATGANVDAPATPRPGRQR